MYAAASGDTVTAIVPGIHAVDTVVAWQPTAALAVQGAVF
jgi:hypothetical protein